MENYIKYSICCIWLCFLACQHPGSKQLNADSNIKLYVANNQHPGSSEVILVISDTDYYVSQNCHTMIEKIKNKEIFDLIRDTILQNSQPAIIYKNRTLALIDSFQFDKQRHVTIDSILLQTHLLEGSSVLTWKYDHKAIEFSSYDLRKAELTKLNYRVDSSYIMAVNYMWNFLRRKKISPEHDFFNIVWVKENSGNANAITFGWNGHWAFCFFAELIRYKDPDQDFMRTSR